MGQWLTATGYLKQYGNDWMYDDAGEIQEDYSRRLSSKGRKPQSVVFIGDAPPARVVEALEYIRQNGPQSVSMMKSLGYRNACAVLCRFGLLEMTPTHEYRLQETHPPTGSSLQAVWEKTTREQTLRSVVELLREKPSASAVAVGQHVAKAHERDWTPATHKRIGNSLRQWTGWLLQGEQRGAVPEPPGRHPQDQDQGELPLC
jgi:hypothetical protein